ncbi:MULTISPECIES: 2'-5' RNA ligase family protein [Paraclostridium]|uniref:2'-5' RNA ligase family protein n=1 Tax=Paraclostridium bifermentans TaxID=1490 RepID=A0AA44DIK5_PARBF|nr:2'-5' RNA ligase family protein [Paraclostridium bifermentans]MCU9810228.1 2'-5' RNA ligase family protein [Paraclostridium sp. AKS46]MDV8114750.1 2'-5' RNA ligase family protein [Bacillus sp. BAU-SS-2023]EQK46483.1 2'-5' RNA ligase superfamily protein [[Clostridium] bifermentans ATCC 19299] [Paraclostridium bifermentans ATCC 19299]MBN8047775.1 2'-5' RNA ligase family protein [Paraclostridium bifermentans]MCR1875622.1 2'-5' RNA ligase family protein [Paraclostridium bifermentans]
MRYVIVSVTKGNAGEFNNKLRKNLFEKFGAKSSKLPPHFTIKSPFESKDLSSLENMLKKFCDSNPISSYKIDGYDHFDDRVVYMKVLMSPQGKMIHDKLIIELSKFQYIKFDGHDGKDKIFHITLASKKIKKMYNDIFNYVTQIPCIFDCNFDNISIFKWEDNTWVLHKEYLFN